MVSFGCGGRQPRARRGRSGGGGRLRGGGRGRGFSRRWGVCRSWTARRSCRDRGLLFLLLFLFFCPSLFRSLAHVFPSNVFHRSGMPHFCSFISTTLLSRPTRASVALAMHTSGTTRRREKQQKREKNREDKTRHACERDYTGLHARAKHEKTSDLIQSHTRSDQILQSLCLST